MFENQIEQRRQRYFKLSSQLAQLDNTQLHSLFNNRNSRLGWGLTHTIVLGQSKVFVKRVPITRAIARILYKSYLTK